MPLRPLTPQQVALAADIEELLATHPQAVAQREALEELRRGRAGRQAPEEGPRRVLRLPWG